MKKSLVVAVAVTVLPVLVGNALADDAPPLALGSRLRVTTDRRVVGKLLAQDDQSLTLDLGKAKDPVVVPRVSITRVEESLRPSRRGDGAVGGAAVGAALAIGLGLVFGKSCGPKTFLDFCYSHTEVAAGAAILLVPPGALIGALTKGERWRSVPLDRIRVGLAPTRGGGIGASVSLSF